MSLAMTSQTGKLFFWQFFCQPLGQRGPCGLAHFDWKHRPVLEQKLHAHLAFGLGRHRPCGQTIQRRCCGAWGLFGLVEQRDGDCRRKFCSDGHVGRGPLRSLGSGRFGAYATGTGRRLRGPLRWGQRSPGKGFPGLHSVIVIDKQEPRLCHGEAADLVTDCVAPRLLAHAHRLVAGSRVFIAGELTSGRVARGALSSPCHNTASCSVGFGSPIQREPLCAG